MSAKKGTKAAKEGKEPSSYDTRDVVLGKVRGYPAWPGMIVDPESVPPSVASERPTSKKTNFYCVRFFPTGDYAWLVPKDISKLQTHEIESYISEPYKKSADLLAGYRIALDPATWEAKLAAVAAQAGEEEANAEIDQLEESAGEDEEEEEGGEGKKKKNKGVKRKREEPASAVSAGKGRKKATKKEESEPKEKKKKEKKDLAAAPKKNGTAAAAKKVKKALVESEDDAGAEDEEEDADGDAEREGDDAGPSNKKTSGGAGKASPPPTKKAKREKDDDGEEGKSADPEGNKVRDWRHKLQKAFLGKSVPKDEDMPALDTLFATVENYEGMTVEYLTFSKIGKVMRHIAILDSEKVPRDDELKFRDRAKALVDRWHQILNANKTGGTNGAEKTESNGKEEKGEEKEVTEGTAALDLNGSKESESPAVVTATAVDEAGDTSILGDVTMSEA